MNLQQFDIVISGGGLSGCLMALSLAHLTHKDGSALRLAIIETTEIKKSIKQTFDERVLALAHGSACYLQQLGVWSVIKQQACAIKDIHISDRGHYGKARLSAQNHHVDALGYVVPMSVIGEALVTALANVNNITWFTPDSIEKIDYAPEQVTVSLASKQQLSAKLLLGCDGGSSVCRQMANITASESDYQQAAIIANVACENPHLGKAFERFTEHGPLAMLPMTHYSLTNSLESKRGNVSQGRCSLVWTLPPEQANNMAKLADTEFAQQLEQHFGTWLGQITHVGKRDVYPLKLIQAQENIYHRTALIGNAAHTIHPIAGQGFNLGLRDVKQMAELIEQALTIKQDLGSLALLNKYSRLRAKDLQQVITLTDSLVTLFSNQLPPLVVGRNIGLKVLNYVKPLKNTLVKKTMGY